MRPVLRARSARAEQALLDGSGAGTAEILTPSLAPPEAAPAAGMSGLVDTAPEFEVTPPAALPDPVARLRELMRERQDESMRILSGWIGQKEEA